MTGSIDQCAEARTVDKAKIDSWFCQEVLPLERSLAWFVQRNCRVYADVMDLTHDIYEKAYKGARGGLPDNTRRYLFTVARNHLINCAKRARIVSFEQIGDLDRFDRRADLLDPERHLHGREAMRHFEAGLAKLTPRVREIVRLRKVEGLTVRETAERLGIGRDAVNHQVMMGMRALSDHMLGGTGQIVRRRRETHQVEAA